MALFACALVLWNLLLICQYRYGLIPAADGADPVTLVQNVAHLLVRKRWLLVGQVLAAPLLLSLVYLLPRRRRRLVFPEETSYHEVVSDEHSHRSLTIVSRERQASEEHHGEGCG